MGLVDQVSPWTLWSLTSQYCDFKHVQLFHLGDGALIDALHLFLTEDRLIFIQYILIMVSPLPVFTRPSPLPYSNPHPSFLSLSLVSKEASKRN